MSVSMDEADAPVSMRATASIVRPLGPVIRTSSCSPIVGVVVPGPDGPEDSRTPRVRTTSAPTASSTWTRTGVRTDLFTGSRLRTVHEAHARKG